MVGLGWSNSPYHYSVFFLVKQPLAYVLTSVVVKSYVKVVDCRARINNLGVSSI